MKHSNIELIFYDFDGIMTNNKVLVDQFGNESVLVNRADGLAVAEIKKCNIPQMIISTEKNPVVQKRAEKLNIPVINGVENKRKEIERIINDLNLDKNNVVFVGNDINDIEAMNFVGLPVAPNDAHESVKHISKIITKSNGGEGVIRELWDIINK